MQADGPVMETRIGPNVEVARVQWLDSRSTDIEKLFGVKEGEPNLKGLVLNEGDTTDQTKGGSLKAIAKAHAATIYAMLVDRFEGTMAGHLHPDLSMQGWMQELTHEVKPDGEAVTRVLLPESIRKLDMRGFLDSNTRQAIERLVQPI
jgi:hypothetical protein